MSEIVLTRDNFKAEVLDYKGLVLVDFWAVWCGPCKMLSPVIHEISINESSIKVGKVNVDEEMELAMKYKISSIPTVLLFKDGEIINQHVGYASRAELEKMWQAYI